MMFNEAPDDICHRVQLVRRLLEEVEGQRHSVDSSISSLTASLLPLER